MTIIIHTASFFDTENHKGKCYSIARAQPKGANYPNLAMLAPSWQLVFAYKTRISSVEYTRRYQRQVLDRITPRVIYEALTGSKAVTLLCWEPAGAFCHRQIVAKWLCGSELFTAGEML